MNKSVWSVSVILFAASSAMAIAQSKGATYITDEEVKAVNATPGVDRTIKVVDIGPENFSVGVIHRGASAAARGTGAAPAAGAAAGRGAAPPAEPCGEQSPTPPTGGTPGAIAHDQQTESYLIISGGGTLVTGGKIVNGRRSGPESDVTKILNGPSCSGTTVGADVVKKVVKTGDIIIIPAGVPHGWTDITDHVDYLSFRPSARILEAGYTHPSIKK